MQRAIQFILAAALGTSLGGIPDGPHPDFTLDEVPFPAKYKVTAMAFLKDGRMALSTIDKIASQTPDAPDPMNRILLVSNFSSGVAGGIKVEEIAHTWLQPSGLVTAADKLYASDRDGFYELLQLSVPGDASKNRRLIMKWPDEGNWKYGYMWHQWVFTPMFHQGAFYAPLSGSIRPGGPSDADPTSRLSGGFLKWDLMGKLEGYAGGLRSPNGANIDPATGEMMVADNQGSWLPASTFALMKPGRFYGHRQTKETRNSAGAVTATHPANWAEPLPYEPPIAWLPHGQVRDSPSQPVVIPSGIYAGDWLLGDVDNPGLIRIAIDRTVEPYNGAVFFFSKGTRNAAINRLAWGPDEALYIGTLCAASGNWPNGDAQPFFRLRPKPGSAGRAAVASAFEMKSIRSLADGLEIEFTSSVDPVTAGKEKFAARQWQYIREEGYGLGKQSEQALTVSAIETSPDGLRVHLRIAGLVKDRLVHVKHAGILSAAGKTPWNDEAWFTLNTVSTRTWNPVAMRETSREDLPKDNPAMQVARRMDDGRVAVALAARGPWKASLVTFDGRTLEARTGSGSAGFDFGRPGLSGLHFLRIVLADDMGRGGTRLYPVVFP